jgi:hypothetical protein
VSSLAVDLRTTSGYLVADASGRLIGRVEGPMYGTRPDEPDAVAVRKRFLGKRHLVPAEAIETVDNESGVIGLSVERDAIQKFL